MKRNSNFSMYITLSVVYFKIMEICFLSFIMGNCKGYYESLHFVIEVTLFRPLKSILLLTGHKEMTVRKKK